MKNNRTGILVVWLILVLFTVTQCRKEAVLPAAVDPGGTTVKPPVIPEASELNTFIWGSMHDWYLWNDKISNLTNTYYQPLTATSPNYKRNVDSLNVFLNKYSDPSKLFSDLLYQYKVVDKWSFMVNDYTIIENWIAGISKTKGYDYQFFKLNSTSDIIVGVIKIVLPGSPAEKAGIKRGDIFIKIDGTQLTTSNYQTLDAKESFTLTLAQFANNGDLVPTVTTPLMTAVQMQEDPVYLSKVITVNGSKVGYLVYNGFTSDYDLELNTVFQQFKTAGVNKLILDLRYNGGGQVQTAVYLASMIYTTNTSKLFTQSVYNSILSPEFSSAYGANFFLNNFTDKIKTTPINTLNLTDVYFIVTGETASASELLINGLKPYMNVKIFGSSTLGKYVASTTLYDYAVDSKGNLISDGKGGYVKISSHKYAMQPIISKYANSQGVSDFVNGLTPDISAKEDYGNLLQFGDENETLLKAVLDYIKGLKSQRVPSVSNLANSKLLFDSKDQNRFAHEMYVDPGKFTRRTK